MQPDRNERRLAAIMFTDIVGYTALMAASEERGLRARARHRALVQPLVRSHHGESIEAKGDESLSVFPNVLDAVHCALAIEDRLREEPELRLHMGIHLGDVVVRDEEVSGDGVNIASRICALSPDGGIRVSGEVHRAIRNQPDVESVALGEHALKNVGQPVAVFAVGRPGTLAAVRRSARWGRVVRRAPVWAGALVVVAAAAGWWMLRGPATTDAGPIRSIAVLPLENLSGDPEQEYFADGMTETLIGDLGKIGSLKVISRTSVMQYKGARKPLPEIAAELGVDALLEGTVMRDGERVRVTAQLIDGRTDHHLWAERYDRELRGVLELQSDVARAVAREVELELAPAEAARLSNRPPVDSAAHDALLKGISHSGQWTADSLRTAIASFERAIELDPGYALAHAWLGFAWSNLAYADQIPDLEGMPKARSAALRALELDDTLAEAHSALGWAALFEWNWPGSEQHFQRALELNPSLPQAHSGYGYLLSSRSRHDDAIAEGRRAVELAPFDLVRREGLTELYRFARRYDDALAEALKANEMDPMSQAGLANLGFIYTALARYEEAIVTIERRGFPPEITSALRGALSRDGPPGYFREFLRIARAFPTAGNFHWLLASIHARIGERDEAFAELELAYAAREGDLAFLRVWSGWDPIRDDPRFADLVRRIGIPES